MTRNKQKALFFLWHASLSLFWIVILCGPGYSTAQVIFFNDYQKAVESSHDRSLPIFIEVCNSKSGKCARLNEEVYSDDEISDILNVNFVNLRLQVDAYPEFRKKYEVTKYPTLIIAARDGHLIDRLSGYGDTKEVLKFIKSVARRTSGIIEKRKEYLDSRSDNALLKAYYHQLKERGFANDARRLIPQFFANLPEPQEKDDLDFVLASADHYRSQSVAFIINNIDLFDRTYGKTRVTDVLCSALVDNLPLDKSADKRYVERRISSIFRAIDYQRFIDAYIVHTFSESLGADTLAWVCESGWNRLLDMDCEETDLLNDMMVNIMLKDIKGIYLDRLHEHGEVCYEQTGNLNTLDILSVMAYKKGHKKEALEMVQEASSLALQKNLKFVSSLKYFRDLGYLD